MKTIVIAGPTAAGKTDLAISLADLPVEIVSSDSAQIFRHLDIGTGKPHREILARYRHHLVDICDPDEHFSAGDFVNRAREAVTEISARGRTPLFVGGTGLYLDAFFKGLAEIPEIDPDIHRSILDELRRKGPAFLHGRLRSLDPLLAEKLHPNDGQRIARGLEVFLGTGRALSSYHSEAYAYRERDVLYIALAPPRDELYRLIDERVTLMMHGGWIEEVESLISMGFGPDIPALRAIGYREVLACIAGKANVADTIERIQLLTRRYAKRQITWFKHGPYLWFLPGQRERIREVIVRWLAVEQ